MDRHAEGRTALERAVEISDCGANARIQLAELLRRAGEREAQHTVLREGVARCREAPAELLNNLAWVLATSPIAALRDGEQSEQLARRALDLYGRETPEILDTLAAAQAERGDFDAAESTLRRAISQAKAQQRPAALTVLLERSLARVRAGQAIRDE